MRAASVSILEPLILLEQIYLDPHLEISHSGNGILAIIAIRLTGSKQTSCHKHFLNKSDLLRGILIESSVIFSRNSGRIG